MKNGRNEEQRKVEVGIIMGKILRSGIMFRQIHIKIYVKKKIRKRLKVSEYLYINEKFLINYCFLVLGYVNVS